ncbi:hypothetical protein [Vampirovibrio chlorellavorus]|uniref:hypothetical protein n=1 Tax=Vampirovibrio chlorellavorus TaxID=758823 RepID=UPI0026EFFDA1|nr:hypothetical protein [Vampirovibrio chlorellavorus]
MLQALRQLSRALSTGPRDHQALALLRVSVGLGFLLVGQYQLNHPQLAQHWQAQWQTWAINNPLPLYGDFLRTLILPHFNAVLRTVIDLEMLIGGSFVLGVGISLTSWLALFLALNLLLIAPQSNPALLGLSALLIVTIAGLRWGRAGQYYGLEGLWRRAWKEAQLRQSDKTPAKRQAASRTPTSNRGADTGRAKPVASRSGNSGRAGTLRPVTKRDKRSGPAENVRPFERPQKPASAKVRKLEKALKRETDKQKRQPLPEKPEPQTQSAPPAKNTNKTPPTATTSATPNTPAVEVASEPVKVVKIFDHRTPDDDE